ncbi:acetoin utilization protein AcuC [Heliorestis convoluta]|uniref:Acetoin utilization protein AcuC n=1 Tax=Heliorestis convoluta TaxID=356322 RepID=A0A5Q2N2X4_9FIRM|nr:acetoin utilization protein AcuC [Heliorestis convoluta]QGG46925.1 acetoin utilization protein AcuC [Heliorestis convoluta]
MNKLPKLIYSKALHDYKFGPDHPFNPLRLELTVDLIEKYGLIQEGQMVEPQSCAIEDLLMVHPENFIKVIEKASQGKESPDLLQTYGLGTDDTPAFSGMLEATQKVVGSALSGAKMIMEGQTDHVFAIGGGLHHAHRNKASGFCVLNDAAVAIAYLQRNYGLNVAYIDTDAHHGDGVQFIFYDDPTVLTISIHETGRYLFPGTGQVEERGRFEGYGFSVNIPLEAYTEDDSFIEVYEQTMEPILEAFQPDILITQNGCDAHYLDPLTHLAITTKSFEVIPRLAHRLAHKYCKGRWLALGGGGYDHWRVVPRAWTLIWAEMNEIELPDEIPVEWLQRWQKESPVALPLRLRDGANEFPPIPRREIITDKNRVTLRRSIRDAVELIMSRRAC